MSPEEKSRLKKAFKEGTLRVRSVSPKGELCWTRVLEVHRAEVGPESIWEARTEFGPMTLTGGHRIFLSPTSKIETEKLTTGQTVLGALKNRVGAPKILSVQKVRSRRFMYDLTAEHWHNFVLHRSKVVVSNSPDRNYHFRPPEHEGVIKQFNQVFGYIWEDEELLVYIECALDWFNSMPPETESLCSIDLLVSQKPVWKIHIMWGAIVHAMFALSTNWVSEEFSYSIGGVSLDIDRSSKYESLKNNAEQMLEKSQEIKLQTTKIIRGLSQPRFGVGVRSSFGPHVGRGVLSPRNFVGL